jgi:hypothetical protein
MIGNLMKHNDTLYDVLKENKEIFQLLVVCSKADELNVRKVIKLNLKSLTSFYQFCSFKSAVFAIGNSVYHRDTLYSYVEEILSILVNLLNDSLAKTRIHAAGKA